VSTRRWSGIAGILFLACAIASVAVHGSFPDTLKANALTKIASFYADRSHDSHAVLAVVLGFIGLFFFTWFLGGLWSTLRDAEGTTSAPTVILAVGGAAFFALAAGAHMFNNVTGISAHFDKAYHQPDPKIALTMLDLGTGAILASAMAAGTMTLAALVLIRRTRALPIWIAWLGLAVTVLALPVVPPLARLSGLVLAVWTVAISVVFVTSEAAA